MENLELANKILNEGMEDDKIYVLAKLNDSLVDIMQEKLKEDFSELRFSNFIKYIQDLSFEQQYSIMQKLNSQKIYFIKSPTFIEWSAKYGRNKRYL